MATLMDLMSKVNGSQLLSQLSSKLTSQKPTPSLRTKSEAAPSSQPTPTVPSRIPTGTRPQTWMPATEVLQMKQVQMQVQVQQMMAAANPQLLWQREAMKQYEQASLYGQSASLVTVPGSKKLPPPVLNGQNSTFVIATPTTLTAGSAGMIAYTSLTLHLPLDHDQIASLPKELMAHARTWISDHDFLHFDDNSVKVDTERNLVKNEQLLRVTYTDPWLGTFGVTHIVPDRIAEVNSGSVEYHAWFGASVRETVTGIKRERTKKLAQIHARMDYELGDRT